MCRNHLTHVSNDKFDTREAIKDSVNAQPKGMSLDIDTELQRRHTQCNAIIVEFLLKMRRRNSRMHINASIKFLNSSPEGIILRLIVQEHLFSVRSCRLIVIDPEGLV